jgi:hypothetical protein
MLATHLRESPRDTSRSKKEQVATYEVTGIIGLYFASSMARRNGQAFFQPVGLLDLLAAKSVRIASADSVMPHEMTIADVSQLHAFGAFADLPDRARNLAG